MPENWSLGARISIVGVLRKEHPGAGGAGVFRSATALGDGVGDRQAVA